MAKNRRLKRAHRQLTLAQIARRDALASLGESVAEEQRSASLADRSRSLAKGYASRANLETAEMLARHKTFAAELTGLARQADNARSDATRQTEWQMQTLARADQRVERLEERAKLVRIQLQHTQERVEKQDHAAMARPLQKDEANRSKQDRSRKPR